MPMDVDRIVLDTNVCLDVFVFNDPRCAKLRDALHDGGVIAVTDDACRDEWLRVLRYPDDQKFLELAAAVGARWLLSRDGHLLALAPRMKRDGRFGIATPQAWVELYRASST